MGEHLYRLLCSYGFPPLHWQYNPNKKCTHQRTYLAQNRKLLCVWGGGGGGGVLGVVRLGASHIHRCLLRFSSPCLHPFWHLTWETLTWGFKHWALSITVDPRLWGTSAGWARRNFFIFFSILRAVYFSICAWEGNNSSSGPLRPPPSSAFTYTHSRRRESHCGHYHSGFQTSSQHHQLAVLPLCVCVRACVYVCVSVYLRGK